MHVQVKVQVHVQVKVQVAIIASASKRATSGLFLDDAIESG